MSYHQRPRGNGQTLDNRPLRPPRDHLWCRTCKGYGRTPTGEQVPQPHPYPDQPATVPEWDTCPTCHGRCWVPTPGTDCQHCETESQ